MNRMIAVLGFFGLILVAFYSFLALQPYLDSDPTEQWLNSVKVSVGKRVGDIAIDEKSNLLYIAGLGHSTSSGPTIFVLDAQSHKVVDQIPFDVHQSTKLEIDSSSKVLYIAKNKIFEDNGIVAIDLESKEIIGQTTVDNWVSQLMIDENDNYVYATTTSKISKYSKNSLELITTASLDSRIRSMTQDPSTGRIFVAASTAGMDSIYENPVFIVDKQTLRIDSAPGTSHTPEDVAYISESNRIYVPNFLNAVNIVTVFDLDSKIKIDDIEVSSGPNSILYNEFDNTIAVGHYTNLPIRDYNAVRITIIDTISNSITNEIESDSKLELVDLNSANGKLYGIMNNTSLVVINSDGSFTQIKYDDGLGIPYSLANFTDYTLYAIVFIGAIVGLVVWFVLIKFKFKIPQTSEGYQKVSRWFYSVWEKRILTSVVSVSTLNLILLILLPLASISPSEQLDFLLPTSTDIISLWLILQVYALTGTILLFEITIGFSLVAAAIMEGHPVAIFVIFVLYAIISVPIIFAYNKIPWIRRLIYAYFSLTQFSLLAALVFMYVFNQ